MAATGLPDPPHVIKVGRALFSITVTGEKHDLERVDLNTLDQPVVLDHDDQVIALHPDIEHEIATRAVFRSVVEICDGSADLLLETLRDNQPLVDWLLAVR